MTDLFEPFRDDRSPQTPSLQSVMQRGRAIRRRRTGMMAAFATGSAALLVLVAASIMRPAATDVRVATTPTARECPERPTASSIDSSLVATTWPGDAPDLVAVSDTGALWRVSAGRAERLGDQQGSYEWARFSPDGEVVASHVVDGELVVEAFSGDGSSTRHLVGVAAGAGTKDCPRLGYLGSFAPVAEGIVFVRQEPVSCGDCAEGEDLRLTFELRRWDRLDQRGETWKSVSLRGDLGGSATSYVQLVLACGSTGDPALTIWEVGDGIRRSHVLRDGQFSVADRFVNGRCDEPDVYTVEENRVKGEGAVVAPPERTQLDMFLAVDPQYLATGAIPVSDAAPGTIVGPQPETIILIDREARQAATTGLSLGMGEGMVTMDWRPRSSL
jgi:hypothetical protein